MLGHQHTLVKYICIFVFISKVMRNVSAKEIYNLAPISCIKVALYSEICLVFMFNGGSPSSLTICPIDKKIGMENPYY